MIALVDCNNFFVSCERAFRPDLARVPVVVLSNNDGCIVSRSQEVKKLSIPMGMPYFQCKTILNNNNVRVFSSNFSLYGDLSRRVMDTLHTFSSDLEIYSIDEAFLPLANTQGDAYCREIKKTVEQWTKIPVSIGVGPTKVLAKVANDIAKKHPETGGILTLTKETAPAYFDTLPVGDVWGIGRQSSNKLARLGVNTVKDLLSYSDEWIRHELSITGLHIAYELRGTPCFTVDTAPVSKKGITCSRSFGSPVTTRRDMEQAVITYTERVAEKLRHEGLAAKYLSVYMRTSLHGNMPISSAAKGISLDTATSSTPLLAAAAADLVKTLFQDGVTYAKAGVFCTDLVPEDQIQQNLFSTIDAGKHRRLMRSLDRINQRFGRHTLQLAGSGLKKPWSMRKNFTSPEYTTRLEDIPRVKAA